jgi:S-adenosyl-L-homocysteine hydrolase, NAD binding domain
MSSSESGEDDMRDARYPASHSSFTSVPGLPWESPSGPPQGFRFAKLTFVHCAPEELAELLDAAAARLAAAGFGCRVVVPDGMRAHEDGIHGDCVTLVASACHPENGHTGFHESSTTLFAHLTRYEVWVFLPGEPGIAAERHVASVIGAVFDPFTSAELAELSQLNPLVWRTAAAYAGLGTSLSEITLLFREHLLLEKMNLLLALLDRGLRPPRTIVFGKSDHTFYRYRVISLLQKLGVTVVDSADPIGYVERRFRGMELGGHVIVVDDGADLAVPLLRSPGPARLAVIETTSKGIRALRRAGLLDQAVNLSDTPIKRDMAASIAVSCVYRFRELLRHAPLRGERCLLVGFGLLGRPVAALLRQMGLAVWVIETDPVARRLASSEGYPVFARLSEAATSDTRYVFGCSGEQSVQLADVLRLGNDVVLCALSSQDLVPVLGELSGAEASAVRGLGTCYRVGDHTITVLADGHAINLHYAEGVNEPDYDSFTALMAAAILESARLLAAGSPGPADPDSLCQIIRDLQLQPAHGSARTPSATLAAVAPRPGSVSASGSISASGRAAVRHRN